RPWLYVGFQLEARREMAQVARRRNHCAGDLNRLDGRAVAIGCPAPNRDRRSVASTFNRALRLRSDSACGFRPDPLLAAQLPGPSSDGWIDRRGSAGLAIRRYR